MDIGRLEISEEVRALFECVDYIAEYCSNHECDEKCALFDTHMKECYLSSCCPYTLHNDEDFKEDKERWIQRETK